MDAGRHMVQDGRSRGRQVASTWTLGAIWYRMAGHRDDKWPLHERWAPYALSPSRNDQGLASRVVDCLVLVGPNPSGSLLRHGGNDGASYVREEQA